MFKKNIFSVFFSALIAPFFIKAQNGYIKGKVTDKSTKEEVIGILVFTSTEHVTSTDISGNYILKAPVGEQTLQAKMVGFADFKQKITVKDNDTIQVDILLENENQVLGEVVISAGKFEQKLSDVTVSMEVIKPALIANKATTSLEGIMNQVPSVNVADGQASIRAGSGFSYGAGTRVIMLVDEMPMISADAGDIKWNYLPLENLEQVEVIKGASSALFGSSALNGVINLRTAYAKNKPITSITFNHGFYGSPRQESLKWWRNQKAPEVKNLSFYHLQKIGKLDFVIAGNLFEDQGFRMLGSETRGRMNMNLRYNFEKIRGLSVGVNTNMMDTYGGLFFLWQNADSAYIPQGRTIQGYHNQRFNIDPFITYSTEKFGKLSLRTRYFKTRNVNDKNQSSTGDLYYGELQYQKRFARNLTLTSGIVLMSQQIYSDSLYGRREGYNTASYIQLDKKIKKLTISGGLRGEFFRVDTARTKGSILDGKINNLPFQPVARLGVNYQLFEYTFLRSSFGQGYRFPSIAEKYIRTNVSALQLFPNNSLQPEYGWSAELGVKQGFKVGNFKGFLDVAGFWTEYRNMVEFIFGYYYPTANTLDSIINNSAEPFSDVLKFTGFQAQNTGRARVVGIDIGVTGTGKIGKINVTTFGGYTYSNPTDPNFNPAVDTLGSLVGSNILRYRNRHLFKNDIQFDYKGFSLGWSVRYNSLMENIDNRFTQPLLKELGSNDIFILPGLPEYIAKHTKGCWLNDIRFSYAVSENMKLSLIVNNFTNQMYMSRPGYIEAPRTVVYQVNFKF